MTDTTTLDLTQTIDALHAELRGLAARLSKLELTAAKAAPPAPVAARPPVVAVVQPPEVISEELLMVISAAVATYLGERAHIRQIRLTGSKGWGLLGRVSIQASHSLHSR